MNILIVGEYSGFAKNLKLGFESLGHHVVVFQEGDGWKKIDTGENSFSFPFKKNLTIFGKQIRKTWFLSCFYFTPKFRYNIKKYSKYFDVVLIINYEFIRLKYEYWLPKFSMKDIKQVSKSNAKVYLSACGVDYIYLNHTPFFRYTPFKNIENNIYFKKRYLKKFKIINDSVDGVIPVMYEYAVAYRQQNKLHNLKILPTIPLPLHTKSVKPFNVVNEKIIIFHGLNSHIKGSEFIVEALNLIAQKYPTKVEVIIDGKMPFYDYLKLLQRTNIVVDQCFGYGYGMNALYSMAMGKVVLSGCEPESAIEFKLKEIPVINILPEVNQIVRQLEVLIKDPALINEFSKQSVEFVNNFHNDVLVATQYIDLFKKDIETNGLY